jgi:gas vesicle structural protein
MSNGLMRPQQQVTLVELVDRILDKGVVLSGDITLAVADVDLVQVGLRALLSSVAATERERAPGTQPRGNRPIS